MTAHDKHENIDNLKSTKIRLFYTGEEELDLLVPHLIMKSKFQKPRDGKIYYDERDDFKEFSEILSSDREFILM